jgi:diguanylate cyclase (GGDEF)-like protein
VFGSGPDGVPLSVFAIGFVSVVQTLLFYLYAVKMRRFSERLLVISLGLDTITFTGLILFTGGDQSSFYLLYYLTVSFGAYFLGLQRGLLISFAVTSLYSITVSQVSPEIATSNMLSRVIMTWALAFGIGTISKYAKQSESKLLKLLDTLNIRTTELEQSRVQIENIFGTSRMLGEILNREQLLGEISRIAGGLLGFTLLEIILVDPETGGLERVSEASHGKHTLVDPPRPIRSDGVVGRVALTGHVERIVDVKSCPYYISVLEGAKSELAVPMVSRGRMVGVMNFESKNMGNFTEHDQKLVSILAGSAALAIDNARLHRQVVDLAVIDELTGTYNYRFFADRFMEEKKRAERYNLPLSLIMLDIDWFKRLNDTYGHESGNIVLRELASVAGECIRDTDQLCRYGGEEFVVILPQTSTSDAMVIGNRIRDRVDATRFGGYGGTPKLHVTVSVGVTGYPDNGLTADELMSAVDSALYRAKGSGKNQVISV